MGKKFSEGKPYKVVALCMTCFNKDDQVRLMNKLFHNCEEKDIRFVIFSCIENLYEEGMNNIGEAKIFASFDVTKFDAIIVMSETFKRDTVLNALVSRAIKNNVPVISVDREIEGCMSIVFDYGRSFEEIVRHVVEFHGVRTINFIAGFKDNPFSEERIECFKRVLEDNGIEFDERRILYGDFWAMPTRNAIEEFIKSGVSMPEAFICANDVMAIECMRVLKEHGYRIPEDIIVTGYDGIDLERYYSPRLTTAEFDIDALGDTVYRVIQEIAEGKSPENKIVINYRNKIGESCGCKPIVTGGVEEKLVQVRLEIDRRDKFSMDMYNMIARLAGFPMLHYIFPMMPGYVDELFANQIWVCFDEDVLDENMDISPDFNREEHINTNYTESDYTDKMKVPIHIILDKWQAESDFIRSDLLPDMDKILDENRYIMFLPFHLQGVTMGYLATTFDIDKFKFDFFQIFSLDFRHVVENYVSRSATEQLYVRDMLTQIYNRHGFYRNIGEIMKKSSREGLPFTLISIDMDGLKQINDTYGHAEGDFALKKIAECMRNSTSRSEICTRFGGDEFVIAFCDERGEQRGNEIINEMYNRLKAFNSCALKPYYVRMSVGMYSKIADEGDTLDLYIKCADGLMYANKKENKQKETTLR